MRGQFLLAAALFMGGCATTANCPPLAMLDGVVSAREGTRMPTRSGLVIKRGAGQLPPTEHMPLERGDVLSTGPDTVAIISFAGARVVLKPNSQVTLGSLLADFGEFLVSGWLKLVQTKTVAAKSHGTKYDVKVEKQTGKTTVTVLEGEVTLRPTQETLREISVAAGQRVSVAEVEVSAPTPTSVPKEELNALTAELAQVDKPRETLPDVVGLALDAALLRLAERGLKQPEGVFVKMQLGNELIGSVAAQLPVAGAYSNTVTLTVNEPGVAVPNVLGQSREVALRAIQVAELGPCSVADAFVKDPNTAVVVAQSPAAGSLVLKNAPVELTLASVVSGAEAKPAVKAEPVASEVAVRVPDLTGVAPDRALGALENAGLTAQIELTYQRGIRVPRVLSQDPVPNQLRRRGDTVRLVLVAAQGE